MHPFNPNRRRFHFALGALAMAQLSGCGFQLRQARAFSFNTVQITGLSEHTPLFVLLKRQIQANGSTRVVSSAQEAEVQLKFLGDERKKDILSLTGAGKVREYQLLQTLSMTLTDNATGKELLAPVQISASRDMTYNDNQVLAKEQEETVLYKDMQTDLVQQIIRRLSAVQRTPN